MVPHGCERLGEDAGGAEHGHEIGVAAPSGDDVLVEVFGNSCSGGFSEVDADVKAVRFEGSCEELFSFDGGIYQAEAFLLVQVFYVWNFSIRENEEVSCVVGIAVHEDEAMLFSTYDEVVFVVVLFGEVDEGAAFSGSFLLGDVFHSPVCVQMIHRLFGE